MRADKRMMGDRENWMGMRATFADDLNVNRRSPEATTLTRRRHSNGSLTIQPKIV